MVVDGEEAELSVKSSYRGDINFTKKFFKKRKLKAFQIRYISKSKSSKQEVHLNFLPRIVNLNLPNLDN